VEQLQCAGVVAAVTLSRLAFPNRIDNENTTTTTTTTTTWIHTDSLLHDITDNLDCF
jgi:hypothetical protein